MTPGLSGSICATDRQYLHRLAVFRDGAARHDDALRCPRIFGNLVVRKRLAGDSSATICLSSARSRSREPAPPSAVATWLRKILEPQMPRAVSMYFLVVTRDTVDQCRLEVSADFVQHQRPTSPSPGRKTRWRSTIAAREF